MSDNESSDRDQFAFADIDDYDPTDCVLCDFSADTPEAFNRHFREVHKR